MFFSILFPEMVSQGSGKEKWNGRDLENTDEWKEGVKGNPEGLRQMARGQIGPLRMKGWMDDMMGKMEERGGVKSGRRISEEGYVGGGMEWRRLKEEKGRAFF